MILASSGMTSTGCSCLFPPGNVYHMVSIGLSVAKQSKAHHTFFWYQLFLMYVAKHAQGLHVWLLSGTLRRQHFRYVCMHI